MIISGSTYSLIRKLSLLEDRTIHISLVQFNVIYRSMVLFLFEKLINFPWKAIQVIFNIYKKNIRYFKKIRYWNIIFMI